MTKNEVNEILGTVFSDDRFVNLWWGMKLFAGRSANEVWEDNPQEVIDRVQLYLDPNG